MEQQSTFGLQSFEQILAAASHLQQLSKQAPHFVPPNNNSVPVGIVNNEAPQIMDLVGTQQAIQSGALSLDAALLRISALALRLVQADGAGVWLFEGDAFTYRAGAGTASANATLQSLILSKLLQGKSTLPPTIADSQNGGAFGVTPKSLLAAPIFQGEGIAGALAVFSETPDHFSEQGETSIRLLTGLLSLAVEKNANEKFKDTINIERGLVLKAIETLVPSLKQLLETTPLPSVATTPYLDFLEKETSGGEKQSGPDQVQNLRSVEAPWADPPTTGAPLKSDDDIFIPAAHDLFSALAMQEGETTVDAQCAGDSKLPSAGLPTLPGENSAPVIARMSHAIAKLISDVAQRLRLFPANIHLDAIRSAAGNRFVLGCSVPLLLGLLTMKGDFSKMHNLPVTSPARPHTLESSLPNGSHQRVTDAETSAALVELSRFEIRGLFRQARFGDDSAAFLIGMAYETGHFLPQNCAKAARWVEQAAAGGNAAAQYNLSLRYAVGDGVPASSNKSQQWFLKPSVQKYMAILSQERTKIQQASSAR